MEASGMEEKTIKRQEIFKGKIIEVALDEVLLPNGKHAKRELVFHPGGVGIIPITDDDRMIFVKQFRKPLEKTILEIPAGKLDPDDDNPLDAAKRELEEEVGCRAARWEHLTDFYVSPGFADELLHIYIARDLEKVQNPRPQDEDELIELYPLTLEAAKEEIRLGTICDAKTLIAIQYWELEKCKRQSKTD